MSDEDALDVIIVGAGPAGLACAHTLAVAGLQVAVLERGDTAGSKNLSGGRLCLEPIRELGADLLKDAPFERSIVSESIVLTSSQSSMTVRLDNGDGDPLPESVSVLRGRLDPFLADRAGAAGAMVMGQQRVDQVIKRDGRVVGVKVGGEELAAKMVVAADGVLSFLAEGAGLRQKRELCNYALGVKEIIRLSPADIEARFNLPPRQGASRLYIGQVTRGIEGGAFIYTNRDSISLGLVVALSALEGLSAEETLSELLEKFKSRSDIAAIIAGGKTDEYGAHLIPEGGFNQLPALGIPGMLLVGDAAGLVLNTGGTLRGMDLAIASGILAGRAIAHNLEAAEDPVNCIKDYEKALKESFVQKEMKAFKNAPKVLGIDRLYNHYPEQLVTLANQFFSVGADGKSMSPKVAFKKLRRDVLQGFRGYRDLWRISRM